MLVVVRSAWWIWQQFNRRVALDGQHHPTQRPKSHPPRKPPATIGETGRLTARADQSTIKIEAYGQESFSFYGSSARMNIARVNSVSIARAGVECRAVLLTLIVTGSLFFPGSLFFTGPSEGLAQDVSSESSYQHGVLIRFEGPITPLLEQFVYRKLDLARERKADLVIIEIDSPGGFVDSSFNVATRLRDLDWAHTVAFVPREALSGAAIVALGCDEIIMAPNARIGDAGIISQGEDARFIYVDEKIRTNVARRIRDLAAAKGRPPALAEAMVDMDLVVYHVKNKETGETALMTDPEIEASDEPADWIEKRPIIESRAGHFLELNGKRAVELGLAGRIAPNRKELANQLRVHGKLLVLEPTAVDTAVTILNIPLVTGLLLVIGVVALLIEASAPGIGLGGLTSGLCFAIFFWSRFLGGTADWLEVILFAAGVIFLGIELFVIPGFGVAGVSGLLLMLISVLMASQNFVVPSTGRELNTTVSSLTVIVGSGVFICLAVMAISYFRGSLPFLAWMALKPPESETQSVATSDGKGKPILATLRPQFPVQVGDWGVAESHLRPAGRVRFEDEFVDVISDGAFVEVGRQVRVIKISGNRVQVRELEEDA
jgi:membrane-bound serine protease (ClpP class)